MNAEIQEIQMFGKFQQSFLRIELDATESLIGEALTSKKLLEKWFPLHFLGSDIPEHLVPGDSFTTMSLQQTVEIVTEKHLRIILSGTIDGYHEWYWGNGWVQSKIEGVSLLPIGLGATTGLLSLREFVKKVV